MKMEMVEQEDGDGNLARKVPQGVGRTRIEQGYKSRVDDYGPGTLMFTDRQESFKEEIEAGAFHSGETAEVRVSRGIFAELDGEKGKALKLGIGEINDCFKDDAAMARSRALQEAVSHRVRHAQLLHQQHQVQRTSVVRWERFLPQRQLRVLLVEDDDSTRHVVSALLRNCSYEVTSAANGLLAWELLMDQTNHVDLVMTEVVMPCLSGIGLLERIMSNEALKHIPVIMMSSHDSMGIVFKCLSKGAVDFLVKPVRKNELKNLWQHVWRRCHSSSGSGSGSGSQTQKVARPDGAADLNNSGSNDESDNTSSELNIGGGSDNGSGTQTIWTKRAVEVESSHQGTKCDLRGLNADSLLHSPTQTKNGYVLGVEHHEGKGVDIALPLYEKLATSRVATAKPTCFYNIEKGQLESTHEMPGTAAASVRDSGRLEEGAGSGLDQGNAQRAIDLISAVSNKEQDSNEEQQADSEDAEDLLEKHASNSPSSKDKTLSDSSSPSRLELSLKWPRQVEENEREQEGRGGLKHSYSSAFSRYNTSGSHTPLPAGTLPANKHIPAVGCGSLVQESCIGGSRSSSIPFTSQMERVAFPDGGTDEATALPYIKGILHASSNQDNSLPPAFPSGKHGVAACSAKEEAMQITGPETQMPIPPSPGVPGAFGSGKEPRFSGRAYIPHSESSAPGAEMGEVKDCCVSYEHSQGHLYSHSNQNSQLHHHSHHHHHHHHIQHHYHHHHQNQLQQNPMTPQLEDQTVMNVGAGAPMCGSSNMVKGTEGNNGQSGSSNGYGSNGNGAVSLNGSATGSNNGSNGHSNGGQGVVARPGGGSGDSGVQLGAGNGLTHTHGVLLGLDQGRSARREAALTKFRQKRKERCFEKKVRYQSRKRLAEQRPRVRGQFVRQSVHESTIGELE